ncbi:hypothetical protein AAG570_014165 [Ranatra chinensis]|uniref:Amidohydrolase-related domain-containing protein n=1 Tax=Ranatra chinensis TaxID=642074 RepID=A0ABD0XS76_9HEMI
MTYDLIIKNGKVILETGAVETDVAIKDGKIAAIGFNLENGKQTIDAKGLIVSPGMIDAHMHLTEMGPRSDWEGYETGTRAAAKGGITSCIEMPLNQMPATVDGKTLKMKLDAGQGKLSIDVYSFGGLVQNNVSKLHEMAEMGVPVFKCFIATCGSGHPEDFSDVDDFVYYEGAKEIARLNKILAVHAENAIICDELGRIAKESGQTSAKSYVDSRPVFTEVEAVRRALYLADVAGCQLHVCHVSCPEAVEEVTRARQAGQNVTCETCGHYLAVDLDDFEKIGNAAKCSPPIRDKDNQVRLWEKVMKGEVDLVASDHSPCTPNLKEGTVFEAWGGISACQNTLDVFFDEAVQKRNMPLTQFARLIAGNPAKIFHLEGKGTIEVGNDADIVLIKPNSPYVLKAEDLEYRNKMSVYVGRKIGAQVAATIVRGNVVYELGKGIVNPHKGKFLKTR